jgi:hypothetical protein
MAIIGLPNAISSHNNFWIWGPGDKPGEVLLSAGLRYDDLKPRYEFVTAMDTIRCKYAMPYENNVPVCVCRHRLYDTLQDNWAKARHYE